MASDCYSCYRSPNVTRGSQVRASPAENPTPRPRPPPGSTTPRPNRSIRPHSSNSSNGGTEGHAGHRRADNGGWLWVCGLCPSARLAARQAKDKRGAALARRAWLPHVVLVVRISGLDAPGQPRVSRQAFMTEQKARAVLSRRAVNRSYSVQCGSKPALTQRRCQLENRTAHGCNCA